MMTSESSVSIRNVSKSFGRKAILKNIDLEIQKGEIFGLLGPSGAGKTTLVRELAGLDSPTEGENYVFGEKMPSLKLMKRIGYMAQADALYEDLSAEENLKFFSSLYGMKGKHQNERINELMELMGLSDHLSERVGHFSGGMKRRLSLVISLLHEPEMLILDEPTVGIDPILRKSIWNFFYDLNKKGTTIIITTHVMDEAAKCSRLALMQRGIIVASGTPESLKKETDTETLEQAFLVYGGD
ncbi:ABC transporter ATP-binding protein [Salinicoccus halodurans]|uniref:ABC transporter ATP-binding protein n=2 Tax=Salinicoccus halodurans TaxID=407035 RepID=A0ABM5T6K4_9STAP|nr:ABC transporter ATP-binding protein [Salinicoccus halodurans]AKG73111.1 ABC transporter ATP-binding protein [Salinicoccus halodurans]